MAELKQSPELKLFPKSPEMDRLIINPTEGRTIDCFQSDHEFNLYLDQEDFVRATDNYREVTMLQENDCEHEVLLVKNELKKEMGGPDKVRIFRKNQNIFLKPVE